MRLHIHAALKQPGKVFEANMEEAFPTQQYCGREISFASPMQAAFTYAYDGKALVIEGQLKAVVNARCARCDDAFTEEIIAPFRERFLKDITAENEEESYAFEGEYLELGTMLLDNFFLNAPLISVCEAACKGLCPVCGCNLNTAQCACEAEAIEKEAPLAALRRLLNDDKEV